MILHDSFKYYMLFNLYLISLQIVYFNSNFSKSKTYIFVYTKVNISIISPKLQ